MIGVHCDTGTGRYTCWIGVDLNTTGHAIVAADRQSGLVLKLGKGMQHQPSMAAKDFMALCK